MVKAIAIQSEIISMNARKGFLKPKNRTGQKMFRMSCRPKIETAAFTPLFCSPFCHTRKSEIPIMAKSVVQTGAKSQFGGLKKGLFREAYHDGIDGIVKKEPAMPASSQARIAKTSFEKSLRFTATWKEGSFFRHTLFGQTAA